MTETKETKKAAEETCPICRKPILRGQKFTIWSDGKVREKSHRECFRKRKAELDQAKAAAAKKPAPQAAG